MASDTEDIEDHQQTEETYGEYFGDNYGSGSEESQNESFHDSTSSSSSHNSSDSDFDVSDNSTVNCTKPNFSTTIDDYVRKNGILLESDDDEKESKTNCYCGQEAKK